MVEDQNKLQRLVKACHEAYLKHPTSCSHAVWYVIKQFRSKQMYMTANDLVRYISNNAEWEEVQPGDLTRLANKGELIVGGAEETPHGHVVVVYPGAKKQSGGFHYKKKGKDLITRSHGEFALAMSTSKGEWPGAKSDGEKTVFDAWGEAKFNAVRFWRYKGSASTGVNLLTPSRTVTKAGGEYKTSGKKWSRKTRATTRKRSSGPVNLLKTITDCSNGMLDKWTKVLQFLK